MKYAMAIVTLLAAASNASPALAAPGHAGHAGHAHATFNAGEPGDPKKPFRTVEIIAREGDGKMSFAPDRIEVKRGEQIKFVVRNEGELAHELVLDSFEGNKKHAVAMQTNPNMMHHDPNATHTAPKATSEILWRFSKTGTFEYACLIPGHYEAGMKGTVSVVAAKSEGRKK